MTPREETHPASRATIAGMENDSRSRGWARIASAALLLLTWMAGHVASAPQELGVPVPVVRFDHTTHDFGEIPADGKREYAWVIRNDGKAPLEIVNTFPSCGCTASLIENKAIPPGGSGTLRITFDAAGQYGDIRKSIAVVTNDPTRPRVLLTVLAKVLPPVNPRVSAGHPNITGQSYLVGDCASCHAAPAARKEGAELWNAVCAMCHGDRGEGKLASSLRNADYLEGRSDKDLHDSIAYGTVNPRMPGFSKVMGGPLDERQIDSLVLLLRTWGPLAPGAAGAAAPSQ